MGFGKKQLKNLIIEKKGMNALEYYSDAVAVKDIYKQGMKRIMKLNG